MYIDEEEQKSNNLVLPNDFQLYNQRLNDGETVNQLKSMMSMANLVD